MGTVSRLGAVKLTGTIQMPDDMSAVEVAGDWLILGSDETNLVQVLARDGEGFRTSHEVILNPTAEEIDIEGITHDGNTFYVIGSHSCKRKKLDPDKSYKKNLEALEKVTEEPDTDLVCRFHLDGEGIASDVERTTLRPFLDGHKILKAFSRVPGKENGIDLEGVAVHDGRLYIGFRSPVLRGNLTPVLKCLFTNPISEAELVYVTLGGRGIRELTRVRDGFLVLAGPSGEGPGSYQLYLWDGGDCVPGERSTGQIGQVKLLGDLSPDGGPSVEGLALLSESDSGYEVIVVYDGATNGGPTRFHVTMS